MVVFCTIGRTEGYILLHVYPSPNDFRVLWFFNFLLHVALFWDTLLIAEEPALIMQTLGRSCFLIYLKSN